MTSMHSDTESNVSGYIRYNKKTCTHLYISMIQGMESITQDILHIEKNMQNILQKCGPMESQLAALLQSFPRPDINLPNQMETELSL